MYVPTLHFDENEETYVGGLFGDGRSPSLQNQAGEPFLNPVEMGNPDTCAVVMKIRRAPYYSELVRIYGESSNAASLYAHITDALAAYQQSDEVNPFSSKYDAWEKGEYAFTDSELRGMNLFKDKGMCAECHVLDKDERAERVLFTDHTYDSKFRVPTLRNIALTAPYGHNGYFKTLREIVHFYNVCDVSDEFPSAEYPATINRDELGNLELTPEEEADLVAFMETLTDGFKLVLKQQKP